MIYFVYPSQETLNRVWHW